MRRTGTQALRRNRVGRLAGCALLGVIGFSTARGATVTFQLNTTFSGTSPDGITPWLTATFSNTSPGTVTAVLSSTHLTDPEFVDQWFFNLDPSLNPANLVFSAPSKTGSFDDPTISKGTNSFQADSDGNYDILIDFPNTPPNTNKRFGDGDSVTYTITGIASLTADSFNFNSAPAGTSGPFPTAAFIQLTGPLDNQTGWITVNVPEPASAGTILGLFCLTLARRRR